MLFRRNGVKHVSNSTCDSPAGLSINSDTLLLRQNLPEHRQNDLTSDMTISDAAYVLAYVRLWIKDAVQT